MLIPLYWFLLLIGSFLGFTQGEIEGKQVYLAPYVEEYKGTVVAGSACVTGVEADIYGPLCERAAVPEGTIILFPWAWHMDYETQQHVVRHEMEHLLRAEGVREGSAWDEEEIYAVSCAAIWSPYFCGGW